MDDFRLGSVLNDRYRLLSVIGEGGQGAVFKVEDIQENNRLVAVKVVTWSDFGRGNDKLKRITAEYNALRKLSHPAIIAVYDAHRLGSVGRYAVIRKS